MNHSDIKLVIDQLNNVREPLLECDYATFDNAVTLLETLGNQVASRSRQIEKLRDALINCQIATDWTTVHRTAKDALAIPTDSTQILQEWLDSVLGEPVGFMTADRQFRFETPRKDIKPVYFKPEKL